MRITIHGPNRNFPAKSMKPYVRWVAQRILGKDAKNINIYIENVPEIDDSESEIIGQACAVTRDGEKRPNCFIIDIVNKKSRGRQERVLIHELAHVEQFRNNKLQTGWAKWKKRIVSPKVQYSDTPWEKEANKIERKITKEWKAHRNEGR